MTWVTMKRGSCALAILAVTLSAVPAWSHQICPLMNGVLGLAGPPWGGSIKITGTHYDVVGNVTKVTCDTNAGDAMAVCTGCSSPPGLNFQISTSSPTCAPLELMVDSFATFGPLGTEVQVVKNGTPKRECVFHGATPYYDSSYAAGWVAHTVRKFNSVGDPTRENGSFTINSPDGQIFIGKIKIKYP